MYPDVDQLGRLHQARKRAARENEIAECRKKEALPVIHKINRFEAPITIFVHRNDSQRQAPTRCLLLGRDRMNMVRVLQVVGEKLRLEASYVKRLCLPEGNVIHDVDDVKHGGHYVALLPHETFKKPSSKLPNNYTRTYDTLGTSSSGNTNATASSSGYCLVDPETDLSFNHKPEVQPIPEEEPVEMKEASTSTTEDRAAVSEETQTTPKLSKDSRYENKRDDEHSPDDEQQGGSDSGNSRREDSPNNNKEDSADDNQVQPQSPAVEQPAHNEDDVSKMPGGQHSNHNKADDAENNSVSNEEATNDFPKDTSYEVQDTSDRISLKSPTQSIASTSSRRSLTLRRGSSQTHRTPVVADLETPEKSKPAVRDEPEKSRRSCSNQERSTVGSPRKRRMSVSSSYSRTQSMVARSNFDPNSCEQVSPAHSFSMEDKVSLASYASMNEAEHTDKQVEQEQKRNAGMVRSISQMSSRSMVYNGQPDNASDDYIQEKHLSDVISLTGVQPQDAYLYNASRPVDGSASCGSLRRASVSSIKTTRSISRKDLYNNNATMNNIFERRLSDTENSHNSVRSQTHSEDGVDTGLRDMRQTNNKTSASQRRRVSISISSQASNGLLSQPDSRNNTPLMPLKQSPLRSALSRDTGTEMTPRKQLPNVMPRQKSLDEARTASLSRSGNSVFDKRKNLVKNGTKVADDDFTSNRVRSRASSVDSLKSNKDSGYSPASVRSKDSSDGSQKDHHVKSEKKRSATARIFQDQFQNYTYAMSPPHSPIRTYAYLIKPQAESSYEFKISESAPTELVNYSAAPLRYSSTSGRSQWKPDTYPILEEEDVFHARPSMGRSSGRSFKQIDFDEDTGGVFRAKRRLSDLGLASEVQESNDIKVDVPLDQMEAREIDEEYLPPEHHRNSPGKSGHRIVGFLPSAGSGKGRCRTSSDRRGVGHYLQCDDVQRMII